MQPVQRGGIARFSIHVGEIESGVPAKGSALGWNDDGGFLQFDQAAAGSLLRLRQNRIDLFACLNELDLDGGWSEISKRRLDEATMDCFASPYLPFCANERL